MKKPKPPRPPPPALRESFNELFDSIWRFSVICKTTHVPPETCLAMIQSAFFAITCRGNPQARQNLAVIATNRALETLDYDEKNPFKTGQ